MAYLCTTGVGPAFTCDLAVGEPAFLGQTFFGPPSASRFRVSTHTVLLTAIPAVLHGITTIVAMRFRAWRGMILLLNAI